MKLLKFLPIILFYNGLVAQNVIKPIENLLHDKKFENSNTYYKDTNNKLQNCVGTWVYDNGSDYFMLKLSKSKQKINDPFNVYADVLTAKFYYRKDGLAIYDNLNTTPAPNANAKPSEISSGHVKDNKISLVYIEPSFNDCNRRKHGQLKISISTTYPLNLIWERQTNEHSFWDEPCANGVEPDNSEFLIPANMVLTKVN